MFTWRYSAAKITSSRLDPFIDILNLEAPLTANPDSWNIFSRTNPETNGHGTDTWSASPYTKFMSDCEEPNAHL